MNADQILLSRFSDLVRGTDAARSEWSTSIVGGDFTVTHRERQTITFRVALLYVVDTRRIAFQDSDLIGRSVLHPVARAFSIWLRHHDVALRDRLLHLVRVFQEIDVGDVAREPIGSLLD